MRRFVALIEALDQSNRTRDKVESMARYFREAPAEDAVWGLWLLAGNRVRAVAGAGALRESGALVSGYPEWMVAECYERVGDLAETLALLVGGPVEGEGLDEPLHRFMEERVLWLRDWDESVRLHAIRETWSMLDRMQMFVFNKMLTGGFRLGVSRSLVIRALAEAFAVPRETIAHRLSGEWRPDPAFFRGLQASGGGTLPISVPYPFFLASPLSDEPATLGPLAAWAAEWKWDGIRAQLIHRRGQIFIWSRGEELVTHAYPEVAQAAAFLPGGTVLDGELLCWTDGRPAGFNALQARIGRKRVSAAVLRQAPVIFMAYDLLEGEGIDLRERPWRERRSALERLFQAVPEGGSLRLSPLVAGESWEDLARLRGQSRERGVEGLILKHRDSPYRVGRVRGDWWKWKVDPFTADLVMVYAQAGHGRRGGLFTDYTLAAWEGDSLVPVAKAYSGLSDAEIRELDHWIKTHTLRRHGPVRTVPAEHVFEIAFEGIRESTRHRGGIALRFPRIHRWRRDKSPAEADTVARLRTLINPD